MFTNVTKKENKDKKISFLERGTILVLCSIVSVILWKLKKAKTYGDLAKLQTLIEDKLDYFDEKYDENYPEDKLLDDMQTDREEFEEELKTI